MEMRRWNDVKVGVRTWGPDIGCDGPSMTKLEDPNIAL